MEQSLSKQNMTILVSFEIDDYDSHVLKSVHLTRFEIILNWKNYLGIRVLGSKIWFMLVVGVVNELYF